MKSVLNKISGVLLSSALLTTGLSFAHQDDDLDPHEVVVHTLAQGNISEIQQLFDDGLNINQDIQGDGTPLIIAVRSGNKDLVEYLLNRGADVNTESTRDGTALTEAAANNDVELLSYLYAQGAVIDTVTKFDETALITASRAGNYQAVKYLVEQGADVNLAVEAKVKLGKEMRSPLNGAKTKQIRDYLIEKGARI